jgi:hypothetical protein
MRNIRFIWLFIQFAFCCNAVFATDEGNTTISREEIVSTGLPLLEIETVNNEEPTYEEGEVGIINATKVPARMKITVNGNMTYDSGDYNPKKGGLTIKVRGNSSALIGEKKPYKLKLQVKADLLQLNDGGEKYKDWVLIKEKQQKLNTQVGSWISRRLGMPWTPRFRYVNVILNGDYRGLYLLCESVEAKSGRVETEADGYLFERDPYWMNEAVYFESSMGMQYTFKYPDEDEITSEQIEYIKGCVNDLEQAVTLGTYDNYIDVESFALWLLAHDILGTWDSGGSNIFLVKANSKQESKITMGPLWDYDTIEWRKGLWARIREDRFFYIPYMLESSERLINAYIEKWNNIYPTLFNEIVDDLDDYAMSDVALALNAARMLDHQRWPGEIAYRSVEENVAEHKTWFAERLPWMISRMQAFPTCIRNIENEGHNKDAPTFDISGHRVHETARGIIIRNGKKILRPSTAK